MSQPFMRRIPPFSPTQISGCQLWLDAADSATISFSSGTSVSQWNDKSGANNHALQATTANQPSTYTSANGLTGMNFGTSNFFRGSFSSPITGTTLSAFVILNMNASTYNYGRALSLSTSNNNDYIGGAGGTNIARNAGNVALWAEAFGGSGIAGPFSINTSTNYIVDSMFDGTTHIAYLNGSNVASVATSSSFSIYLFGIGFQAYQLVSSGADYWIGYINEVIVYNTALTEAQRQNIESYLAQKWGLKGNLPNGHPGFTSVLYPSSRVQSLTPMTYAFTFTPTGVAGCALWLDANDINGNGTTPSNGSTVTTWVDKSGNGNNATSVGTPTYGTNLVLLGGSAYFTVPGVSANSSNEALFIVVNWSSSGADYPAFIATSLDGGRYLSTEKASQTLFGSSYYVATTSVGTAGATPYNTQIMVEMMTTSLVNTVYTNGGNAGSPVSVTYSGGGTTIIGTGIHGSPQGSQYLTGNLYEILIYNTAFTTTQRQQVEGYLTWKWGLQSQLPASHPYKSSSPTTTNIFNVSRPLPLANQYPTPIRNMVPVSNAPPSYRVINLNSYSYGSVTSGTFTMNSVLGGGSITYTGSDVFASSSTWGPQQAFDNIRTDYDWATSGNPPFGQFVFPRAFTMTKIFIVPRNQQDNFPATFTLIVDTVTIGTYSNTSVSAAQGLSVSFTGTGFYVQPNVRGTTWRIEFPNGAAWIGEIEFYGYV